MGTRSPRGNRMQPETSRIAHAKSAEFKEDHQNIIFRIIKNQPGMTMGEIAQISGLGKARVGRRLKEIETNDLIYREGKRSCTCSVCDSMQLQWWPMGMSGVLIDVAPVG